MKKLKLFFVIMSILGIGSCAILSAKVPVDQIERAPLIKCHICGQTFFYGCGHICKPKE